MRGRILKFYQDKRRRFLFSSLFIVLFFLLVGYFLIFHSSTPSTRYSFSRLQENIATHKVKSLDYNSSASVVKVKGRNGKSYSVGVPGRAGETKLLDLSSKYKVPITSEPVSSNISWAVRIFGLLPTILVIGVLLFVLRSWGPMKKNKIEPATSNVSFSDVAGVDEAVQELSEVRDFLSHPQKYERLGARVPKGVLLFGPPGTGKTLLAQAVARESNVPFYSISGSEFVEMFAGLGAQRVRGLFKIAKETAPSIVFIDELDAVGRSRVGGGSGAEREADQTLNQLLTEMDGFEVSKHPVVVIAASNRLDVLDKALLRPGRFDRHIAVDAPDRQGRLEILELHAKGKSFDENIDLNTLAIQTSGMTGAELSHILNEAAIHAARRDAKTISQVDTDDAYLRVVAGARKQNRSLSIKERKIVAYHEAGHALVSEILGTQDKVHKISILPRGLSGGQTIYVSEQDIFLQSKTELERRLSALLGGRAAEMLCFKEATTGASDDLKHASEIVRSMIEKLGMGKSLGFLVSDEVASLSTQQRVSTENEAKEMLEARYQEAYKLLQIHKKSLTRIAKALLEEETLTRPRFLELMSDK